jgi:predicted transglutaminase-like cysteine proteinase
MIRNLAAGMALLAACQTSWAGTSMQVQGLAFPPPAFKQFCRQEPGLCSTAGGAKVINLSDDRMKELETINAGVNRRVQEQNDEQSSGREDHWQVPGKVGDCEDFAILKKRDLIARGWPSSALLLTVVKAWGSGHTVLTVRTDAGDLILDNRTSRVKDWSRTPYRYFARQVQGDGSAWQRIGGAIPLERTPI